MIASASDVYEAMFRRGIDQLTSDGGFVGGTGTGDIDDGDVGVWRHGGGFGATYV